MMNKSNVNVMTGVIAAVLFVLSMVVLGTAEALGTPGDPGTPGAFDNSQNHWNNPNLGNESIGGCSDNGKWCWNIQIGDGNNNYYPTFPLEFYGNRARRLIADGRIEYANMDHRGVLFLGVYSRYHNRYFDCEVSVPRRQYHCVTSH